MKIENKRQQNVEISITKDNDEGDLIFIEKNLGDKNCIFDLFQVKILEFFWVAFFEFEKFVQFSTDKIFYFWKATMLMVNYDDGPH